MSIATDTATRGDRSGTRAAARRAEAAALHAADAACDAYRTTLDASLRDAVRPDRVVAVVDGVPGDALATAVADLGSAAYAAGRAAHLAIETGDDEDVQRTASVATAAGEAAALGASALRRRGATEVEQLAHVAAMLAHLCADALEAYGAAIPAHSLRDSLDHPAVPFPPSWRRRIERLRVDCTAVESPDKLHAAAMAACAASERALVVYSRSGHGTVVSRTISRVTRIAALAACYAAGAALQARA